MQLEINTHLKNFNIDLILIGFVFYSLNLLDIKVGPILSIVHFDYSTVYTNELHLNIDAYILLLKLNSLDHACLSSKTNSYSVPLNSFLWWFGPESQQTKFHKHIKNKGKIYINTSKKQTLQIVLVETMFNLTV